MNKLQQYQNRLLTINKQKISKQFKNKIKTKHKVKLLKINNKKKLIYLLGIESVRKYKKILKIIQNKKN